MPIDYTIIRSNRKTISILISSDNKITVRCPCLMSDSDVETFISCKSDWIRNVIAKNSIKHADNESILNYREIFVGGRKLSLVFCDKNKIDGSAVYVKNLSSVKKVLSKYLSAELMDFAEQISAQINLCATNFLVRSYKSRWGCCDKKGAITLNCLLVMLPLYLQRYVIIHELCHTVYFNHSQKFWSLVAKFEPNYKLCRKDLKNFNYLTKLY